MAGKRKTPPKRLSEKARAANQELRAIRDLVNGKPPKRTRFIKQELNSIKDLVNGKKPTKPKPRPKPKPSNGGRRNA